MKKKIFLLMIVNLLMISLWNSQNVFAVEGSKSGSNLRKEIRNEIKNEANEKISTISGTIRQMFKNKLAMIQNGTLNAKNGTTLIVTKDNKSISILTDAKTQLRRRFWGKATLDEMQIGDTVNVIGTWTDDTQTTIQARLIRDMSIQKRFGVFFGTVQNLNSTGWVMQTINRGNQTVTISSSTKIINRKGQTINQANVVVGHRVRVRGLWNNKANTITEVTEVKDFSLPPILTPTPKI